MNQDREMIKILVAALEVAHKAYLEEHPLAKYSDIKEQKRIVRKRREVEQVVKYAAESGREYLKEITK